MQIRSLDHELAPLVGRLYYSVFGYTHSDIMLYEPDQLMARAEAGLLFGFAAVSREHGLVGYFDYRFDGGDRRVASLGVLATNPVLGEGERGVVLNGLLKAMVQSLRRDNQVHGTRLVMTTDTTDHDATQRLSRRLGLRCSGLLFGTVPAGGHRLRRESSDSLPSYRGRRQQLPSLGRRAETLSVYAVRRTLEPYTTSIPEPLDQLVRSIYALLGLPAEFTAPGRVAPRTHLATSLNLPRGIATIVAERLGADASESLRAAVDHFRDGSIPVVHVLLPISGDDYRPALDEMLCAGGLLGGLLPRFRGQDMILLQFVDGFDESVCEDDFGDHAAREIFRYFARQRFHTI